MKASVIFTTYNQPDWLEKTFWGFYCQSEKDFEVVVADDGSNHATRCLVEQLRAQAPFPVKYIWQPDEGFRKCAILNKAILQASSDYLIFTDGDCIPRADFVEEHLRCKRPGHYLSGGYFKLPRSVSAAITQQDVEEQRVFDLDWLKAQGVALGKRALKMRLAQSQFGAFFNAILPTKSSFNGHNASCYKTDAIKVNGFNEAMEYGGLDIEFGVRLRNSGVQPRLVRYSTVTMHLDHDRAYATPEMRARSAAVKANTKAKRLAYCEQGLTNPCRRDESY
jgi:glycosyltransferase involved in cell wall biosynthesis